jgi:hypothetical protein
MAECHPSHGAKTTQESILQEPHTTRWGPKAMRDWFIFYRLGCLATLSSPERSTIEMAGLVRRIAARHKHDHKQTRLYETSNQYTFHAQEHAITCARPLSLAFRTLAPCKKKRQIQKMKFNDQQKRQKGTEKRSSAIIAAKLYKENICPDRGATRRFGGLVSPAALGETSERLEPAADCGGVLPSAAS